MHLVLTLIINVIEIKKIKTDRQYDLLAKQA